MSDLKTKQLIYKYKKNVPVDKAFLNYFNTNILKLDNYLKQNKIESYKYLYERLDSDVNNYNSKFSCNNIDIDFNKDESSSTMDKYIEKISHNTIFLRKEKKRKRQHFWQSYLILKDINKFRDQDIRNQAKQAKQTVVNYLKRGDYKGLNKYVPNIMQSIIPATKIFFPKNETELSSHQNTINIKGYSFPGKEIKLKYNGREDAFINSSDDGKFSVDIKISFGLNKIKFYVPELLNYPKTQCDLILKRKKVLPFVGAKCPLTKKRYAESDSPSLVRCKKCKNYIKLEYWEDMQCPLSSIGQCDNFNGEYYTEKDEYFFIP